MKLNSNIMKNTNIMKNKCVIVVEKDKNLKPHLTVFEDMELSKEMCGSVEKREATFIKRKNEWEVTGIFDDFFKCPVCGYKIPADRVLEDNWQGCPCCLKPLNIRG